MVKMDLKFTKTTNKSSFLSINLLFSGFQISFPMFLNNLPCKKTSYCNCNWHLMFLCQECGIQKCITVEWKIIDKFSKMLYQKNENVLWKARYIKVFCLSKATCINFSFRKKSIFWHVFRKYNPLSSLMRKVSCNIQKYYNYY